MGYATHKRYTLGELIEALRALPRTALVTGMDSSVESYRGYYDRNAIGPIGNTVSAHELADTLAAQEGKPIEGWKGGDYTVSLDKLVYLAWQGDTGPSIIGLEPDPDSGMHKPVLLKEDYHF